MQVLRQNTGIWLNSITGPKIRVYTPAESFQTEHQPFLYAISGIGGRLGFIGDAESQRAAIPTIEKCIEEIFPGALYLHLFLRYHSRHNVIVPFLEFDGIRAVVAADGVIFRRGSGIVAETCVADCPTIAVFGKEYVGFMHAGRPEVTDRIVPEFFRLWREFGEDPAKAVVLIGPGIAGEHYDLGEDVLEPIRQDPDIAPHICETEWGDPGFSVQGAILADLQRAGVPAELIWGSLVDTFFSSDYASDRRERKAHACHSWRDCYFVGSW